MKKAAYNILPGTEEILYALNNLDKDLLLVARDDELGRQLQDLNLIIRKRAPRRS